MNTTFSTSSQRLPRSTRLTQYRWRGCAWRCRSHNSKGNKAKAARASHAQRSLKSMQHVSDSHVEVEHDELERLGGATQLDDRRDALASFKDLSAEEPLRLIVEGGIGLLVRLAVISHRAEARPKDSRQVDLPRGR